MRRLAAIVALVLTGCGQATGAHSTTGHGPSPASGPVVASTPATPTVASGPRQATPPRIATPARIAGLTGGELIALYVGSPPVVHFVTLDGREVLAVNLVNGLRFIGGVRGQPYFADPQGYVSVVRRDGTSSLVLATGQSYAVFSPDLQSWSYADSQGELFMGTVHSDVHVAGVVAAGSPGGDRVIASATESGRRLYPYRWSAQGLWLVHGGYADGYLAFGAAFGPADLVDPRTGAAATHLDCGDFDLAADGTVACLKTVFGPSPKTLVITRPSKAPVTVELPGPNFTQAGNVLFLPGGSRVAVAGARGDPTNEHFETDVIDVATGQRKLWVDGYGPAAGIDSILPDGRLLVKQPWDDKAQQGRGFGIAGADGNVTPVYPTGQVIGVVRP